MSLTYRYDPRYRFQQEANGSWSVYEGGGYRRGAFRSREQAEAWLDGWTEAGGEFEPNAERRAEIEGTDLAAEYEADQADADRFAGRA